MARRDVEAASLRFLSGKVPVPGLLPSGPDEVRMEWVPGIMGQSFVCNLSSPAVRLRKHTTLMEQCGRFIARLHEVPVPSGAGILPGSGTVVAHGDFAPYNVLVHGRSGQIHGVVDWELCHLGHPVEDLAWMEWSMREWHWPPPEAIAALYRAYGRWFPWADRHHAMIERRRPLYAMALCPGNAPQDRARAIEHWNRLLALEEIIDL
jgi:aminoglycoside phosphotransferase (APT) family kinase protein